MPFTSEEFRDLRMHFSQASLTDFFPMHSQLTVVIGQLLQHWHSTNPTGPQWKELLEPLAFRLSFAGATLENLLEGTVRGKYTNDPVVSHDLCSIYTIARTELEAYLTFFDLYIRPESDQERQWRYELYVAHGLLTRQHVDSEMPELQVQVAEERQRIDAYIASIQQNPSFQHLPLQDRNRILSPRHNHLPDRARPDGWRKIIEASPLNTEEFVNRWGLYSNHAHTEYLSLIQTNAFVMGEPRQTDFLLTGVIKSSLMVLAVFIPELVEYLGLQDFYLRQPNELRQLIEFYNRFATRV